VTSAREAYDKDGVVRSETLAESKSTGKAAAAGVPGATTNTPPPAAEAENRAPQGTEAATAQEGPVNGETSSSRTYELGREVSVSETSPGRIKRLSVAVAISKEAMKDAKPEEIAELEKLVSAAVGANAERGDTVAIATRAFEPLTELETPFYETGWFAMAVRHGAAVLALLLVLLLGVRPILKALRKPAAGEDEAENDEEIEPGEPGADGYDPQAQLARAVEAGIDRSVLEEKVGLARRLIAEKPDSAVAALRLMLNEAPPEAEDEALEGAAG
jgi:flagellar M-ring protein FliF